MSDKTRTDELVNMINLLFCVMCGDTMRILRGDPNELGEQARTDTFIGDSKVCGPRKPYVKTFVSRMWSGGHYASTVIVHKIKGISKNLASPA